MHESEKGAENAVRQPRGQGRRPLRRCVRVTFLAAVVLCIVLGAAACGGGSGPGVAHLGSSTSPPSPGPSGSGSALAYAACMRSHGVGDFPDPDAQGHFNIQSIGPNSDLDPHNPTFQAAHRACGSLLPTTSAAQKAQVLAQLLKFSACMRAHGVKNFPDPTVQGGGPSLIVPSSEVDPNNPLVEAAQSTCQKLAPGVQ